MKEELIRAEFEKWLKSQGSSPMKRDGVYVEAMARLWWKCYLAASAPLLERIAELEDAIGVIPESARQCLKAAGYDGLVDWIDRLKSLQHKEKKDGMD